MKKVSILLVLFLSINGLFAEEYSELLEAYKEMLTLSIEYYEDLDAANTPEEVAAAMLDSGLRLQEIQIKFMKYSVKYPEFEELETLPEGFEEVLKELAQLAEKYTQVIMKPYNYMDKPAVQDAMAQMQQNMKNAMESGE